MCPNCGADSSYYDPDGIGPNCLGCGFVVLSWREELLIIEFRRLLDQGYSVPELKKIINVLKR